MSEVIIGDQNGEVKTRIDNALPVWQYNAAMGHVTLNGQMIEIRFDYNPHLVDEVKAVTAPFWRQFVTDNGDRHWRVRYSQEAAKAVMEFANCHGLDVDPSLGDQPTEVPQTLPTKGPDIPSFPGGELRQFQKQAIWYCQEQMLSNGGLVEVILGDQMGLGKTITAIAMMRELGYPALIVCPASLKLMWAEKIEKWLEIENITILRGQDSTRDFMVDFERPVVIVNYDILHHWADHLNQAMPWRLMIFDESHKLKTPGAKRTKAALKLVRGHARSGILLLTGTPALSKPVELIGQLQVVRQFNNVGGSWVHFVKRYCAAFQQKFGNGKPFWNTSGASNLEELNQVLRSTCYVRRTKDEVLAELPAKTHAQVPVEISNREEYDQAEKDIIAWVMKQAEEDREFRESISHLSKEEQRHETAMYKLTAGFKARRAEALVRLAKLKQIAALGKLTAVQGWVEDFLESGQKLVIFAWHREVVERITNLVGKPDLMIYGDTPVEQRQLAVEKFQKNPDAKVLVGNIQAMGIGLTLTAASDVLFVEYPWTPGDLDQAIDRCHRIGQDNAVTAWHMVGTQTIDEDVLALLSAKARVVDAVTEGRSTGQSEILRDLIRKVKERHE